MSVHSNAVQVHYRYRGRGERRQRMIAHFAAAALLATALSATSAGQQRQSITIRVLNAKNGRPLKGVLLLVYASRQTPEQENRERPLAYARTNPEGVAFFPLGELRPEIVLSYGDPLSVGRCTPWLTFSTTQILQTGVVGANNCSGTKSDHTFSPKAGELVIFAKPWSWWERMKHSE